MTIASGPNDSDSNEDIQVDIELDFSEFFQTMLANPRVRQQIVDMVRKDMLKNARYYGNIFGTYAQKTH